MNFYNGSYYSHRIRILPGEAAPSSDNQPFNSHIFCSQVQVSSKVPVSCPIHTYFLLTVSLCPQRISFLVSDVPSAAVSPIADMKSSGTAWESPERARTSNDRIRDKNRYLTAFSFVLLSLEESAAHSWQKKALKPINALTLLSATPISHLISLQICRSRSNLRLFFNWLEEVFIIQFGTCIHRDRWTPSRSSGGCNLSGYQFTSVGNIHGTVWEEPEADKKSAIPGLREFGGLPHSEQLIPGILKLEPGGGGRYV